MLDFARIKEIKLTDVCAKYGISLRFGQEWASAKCPLPTHKEGDKDRTFQVNIQHNYFKCWSASCNEKAGKKGGDCINFVALMERSSQLDAAKKIAGWFHLDGKEKPAPHIEKRAPEKVPKTNPQRDSQDITSNSGSVKGYMGEIDAWFDETVRRGDHEQDEQYLSRLRKAVKSKLIESYRAGKRAADGLTA